MSNQHSQKLFNLLYNRAWLAAHEVSRVAMGDYNKDEEWDMWRHHVRTLKHEWVSEDEIIFRPNGNHGNTNETFVRLWNIRPTSSSGLKVDQPIVKGRKTIDASVHTITNKSGVPVTRTYEVNKGKESTLEQNVSVSVTAAFRQMVKFGNDASPVSGELEFSQEISSGYSRTESKTESSDVMTSLEVEVPPKTQLTFSTTRSLAEYEQKLHFSAGIECDIQVQSYWDYTYGWGSWEQFMRCIQGYGYKTDPHNDLSAAWKGKPLNPHDYKRWAQNASGVPLTVTVNFDEATVSDVSVESKAI